MIGCDGCDRWYHGPCVGVSKAQGDALSQFVCPSCALVNAAQYAFGSEPPPQPKKTRRPRLAHARALLAEAGAIGVEMPEIAPIAALVAAAEAWDAGLGPCYYTTMPLYTILPR